MEMAGEWRAARQDHRDGSIGKMAAQIGSLTLLTNYQRPFGAHFRYGLELGMLENGFRMNERGWLQQIAVQGTVEPSSDVVVAIRSDSSPV